MCKRERWQKAPFGWCPFCCPEHQTVSAFSQHLGCTGSCPQPKQVNTVSFASLCTFKDILSWHFLEITCKCAALSTSWADCIPKQTWEMRWPRPLSRYCSFTMAHPNFIQSMKRFSKKLRKYGHVYCVPEKTDFELLRRLHHYWKTLYPPEYSLSCEVISHRMQLVHDIN